MPYFRCLQTISLAALGLTRIAAFSVGVPSSISVRTSHQHSAEPRPTERWAREKRPEQDAWYDEDGGDDPYYETNFVGESQEEIELRNLPLQDEDYEDDIGAGRSSDRMERFAYDDNGDEFYDDDDDEEELPDGEDVGNFWVNPKEGFDVNASPSPRRRRQGVDRDDLPTSTARPHRRESGRRSGRSKTTFRSGTAAPPAAMEDLYNRLFWYGFDPADTTSPADRTVFGGTKGKFNGLAYLQDGVGVMPSDKRARRRRPRNRDTDEDWEPEVNDYDYEEAESKMDEEIPTTQFRPSSVTPPFDAPQPRRGPPPEVASSRRERRRKPRRRDEDEDDGSNGDWVSNQISSWFQFGDDEDEDNGYNDSDRRGRRRRDSKQGSNSPTSPFTKGMNVFFGLNRDRLDEKAERYNRQMGIGAREDVPSGSRRRSPREQRRKGYAYPYVDEDEAAPVADFETAASEEKMPAPDDATIDVTAESDVVEGDEAQDEFARGRELSWEERALAVERVPPASISAWGPTGDLGMDARTKAISDALEDINGGKQRIKEEEQKVEEARENVAILKVDAELEKKRLSRSRQEVKRIQEQLRRIDRNVDDAARALRYAQNLLTTAQEDLADLQARQWAVLSFYSPELAEESVLDAIRELEESEPAVRRIKEKAANAETSERPSTPAGEDDSSSEGQTETE